MKEKLEEAYGLQERVKRTQIVGRNVEQILKSLLRAHLDTSDSAEIGRFVEFTENHPNLVFVVRGLGHSNTILDIHVKNRDHLNDALFDVREKFSSIIKKHEVLLVFEEVKRMLGEKKFSSIMFVIDIE